MTTTAAQVLAETGYAAQVDDGTLGTWLSGGGSLLDTILALCADTAQGPGWTQIVDVTRCPTAGLPWLAQFVGVRIPPGLSDAQQRAAVQAETGWKRGTAAALLAAAQPYLTSGTPTLLERTPDAYHLTMQVPSASVAGTYGALDASQASYSALDAAYATYSAMASSGGTAALEAAVIASKPAGLILTFTYT